MKRSDGESVAIVTSVTNRFSRYPSFFSYEILELDVYTGDSDMSVRVAVDEIPGLLSAGLGEWKVSTSVWAGGERLSIRPCAPGAPRRVAYNAIGQYACSTGLFLSLFEFFFCFSIALCLDGLVDATAFFGLICIPVLIDIPSYFNKVTVTLSDEGVLLQSDAGTRLVAYSEIRSVEQEFFRFRFMMKNGETVYAPRACLLLAELIGVFMRERAMAAPDGAGEVAG